MAFMFWTFLLLPAMLLCILVEKIITPFIGPLQPVLRWLLRPEVFYLVCKALLAFNLLLLGILLAVRYRWRRAGKLSRAYIESVRGWKRLRRRLGKLLLCLGPFWELFAAAFFVLILLIQPVRDRSAGTSGLPKSGLPFEGSWQAGPCVAVSPDCPLSQEAIDAWVGTAYAYESRQIEKNGTCYLNTEGLYSDGVRYPVEAAHYTNITADEFEALYHIPLTELGYQSYVISHTLLALQGDAGPALGQELFSGDGQVWLCWQGAFFQAELVESNLT